MGLSHFSPLIWSHFAQVHRNKRDNPPAVAKRFCADFAPSPDALVAKYAAFASSARARPPLPSARLLLKLTDNNEKNSTEKKLGLFAQKTFECDEFITEYKGSIKTIPDNTTLTTPAALRYSISQCGTVPNKDF